MARIVRDVARYLSGRNWPFEEHNDQLVTAVTGQRGNWMVYFVSREDDKQLLVYSTLPVTVPPDRVTAVAIYLTLANYGLAIGNFELAIDQGQVRFKTSIDVAGGKLSEALIDHLFLANMVSSDRYLPGLEAVVAATDPGEAVAAIEG